jgi:predicted GNAT family N-acyltransferase
MHITTINWQDALPIRQQVLWPDYPASFCQIDGDDTALHYGAYLDNQLVCVASLYLEGTTARLRKFATLPAYQKQGIGSSMLQHMLNELKLYQINYFWCDARLSAESFYGKFGLIRSGAIFEKSGIQYIKMERQLC